MKTKRIENDEVVYCAICNQEVSPYEVDEVNGVPYHAACWDARENPAPSTIDNDAREDGYYRCEGCSAEYHRVSPITNEVGYHRGQAGEYLCSECYRELLDDQADRWGEPADDEANGECYAD